MQRAIVAVVLTSLLLTVDCGGTSTPPPVGVVEGASPGAERDASADATPSGPSADAAALPPQGEACSLQCADGSFCDLQSVTCVRAPCRPVPTCIEGTHPCAATTCAFGSRCESLDGKGTCVPMAAADAGVSCGSATCEPGLVCCNASCGICTPPDGACTQQVCN